MIAEQIVLSCLVLVAFVVLSQRDVADAYRKPGRPA